MHLIFIIITQLYQLLSFSITDIVDVVGTIFHLSSLIFLTPAQITHSHWLTSIHILGQKNLPCCPDGSIGEFGV